MESHSPVRERDRELDDILRELTGTRLYRNNIFRLTGLPVTATATQVRRRREEAALMAQLGSPPPGGDLPQTPAPTWDAVNAAFESIRNPVIRLVHELLWLWGAGEEDDHDYAVRRHCGVLEGQSLTAPDRPDMADDPLGQQWLVAVQAWAQVLAGDEIWDRARERVRELDDPRLTTGTVRRLRDRLPRHIVDVHLGLAVKAAEELGSPAADRHLWVLDESEFDDDLIDVALRDSVRPAEGRIRAACEAADHVAETRPKEAIAAGHALLAQTEAPLRTVAAMLGVDDPVTNATHDLVARAANYCAVSHDNLTSAGWPALGILPAARELARERTTIDLIDKNTVVIGKEIVLRKVSDLVKAGKVDKAADRLRAWRRHAEQEWLRDQIDAVLADANAVRTPPKHVPARASFIGWGAYLFGHRRTSDAERYIVTHFFTVFFVPVYPMAAYLRDSGYFYGKVPLSTLARYWRLVVLLLLVTVGTQPLRGLPQLMLFVAAMAVVAAWLGWRRYLAEEWATAQVAGPEGDE